MKSQMICDALNTVNPTPAQRARMRAALEAQLPAEKPHRRGAHQQKASSQRWWTIIPAAAALAGRQTAKCSAWDFAYHRLRAHIVAHKDGSCCPTRTHSESSDRSRS